MTTNKKGRWGKYTTKENKRLFFYPEEWIKIMELAKPRQKLTLDMQGSTGARINEVINVKPYDIDFVRNNLTLRITKVRSRKKETKPTPRVIPISSQFSKRLKRYIKEYSLKQDDFFPLLKHAQATEAIKGLAKKIGRKDWRDFSSHNIRKTFECFLLAVGVDGFKVCKLLGHDARTALQSYISADIFTRDDKDKICDILGDLVSRLVGERYGGRF